jgi:hypothetical protein
MNRPFFLSAVCACGIAGFFAGRFFSPAERPAAESAANLGGVFPGRTKPSSPSAVVRGSAEVSGDDAVDVPKDATQAGTFTAPHTVPRTLKELYDEAQRSGVSPADARLTVMETIGRMNPEQLQTLLTTEANNPDFFRRMRFDFQFAARRFAEIAPQMAAQLWLQNASLRFQSETLLGPWAKREPRAFLTWTLTLPADSQRATASVVGAIAKVSPEEFAALAPLIADTPSAAPAARAAIQTLIAAAAPGSDPADAILYAKALPEGAARTAALSQLAQWPGINLKEHPDITGAIAALPREDAIRMGRELEKSAADLPSGYARNTAFAASLRQQAEKDPAAALARLQSLAGTADSAAAVRGYVDATAAKDPAAAAEWALGIDASVPGQRMAALERVAREMFAKNPDEARAWVEKAPLSDAEYIQLTGRQRAR